tara:strand:- start:126 stop:443 length:318 start_codon:yes stop_codon:yes gene_type:complete
MKAYFLTLPLLFLISFETLNNRIHAENIGINKEMTHSDKYYFNVGRLMAYCKAHVYSSFVDPALTKVIKKELNSVISNMRYEGISNRELKSIKKMLKENFEGCSI